MIKIANPHDIERQVVFALVFEPIAEKKGCTSISHDLSPMIKVTDLISSGINVGEQFYALAERVNNSAGQPEVFYDLYLEALKSSTRYRKSQKYINQGLLGVLFPLVVSRLTISGDGEVVCRNIVNILKKTSEADVHFREETRRIAWSTSTKDFRRNFPEQIGGSNMYEYYTKKLERHRNADKHSGSIFWVEQFLAGMPLLSEMYKLFREQLLSKDFLTSVVFVYEYAINIINEPGIVADYVAGMIYLVLSDEGGEAIVRV